VKNHKNSVCRTFLRKYARLTKWYGCPSSPVQLLFS